jgi:inner membrane protein involved in colicin E2 resistance
LYSVLLAVVAAGQIPTEPMNMFKRIAAIALILLCTSIAWAILGSTIFMRTYSSNTQLKGRVTSSWGSSQDQYPPSAGYEQVTEQNLVAIENGISVTRPGQEKKWIALPLERSRVGADLNIDYRKKGLLWYSTYRVKFAGVYDFKNPDDQPRNVTLTLHLPADQAVYDGLGFVVNGTPLAIRNAKSDAYVVFPLKAGETATVDISYNSQGLDRWSYDFGDGVTEVKDFELHAHTNFPSFNISENALSPTKEMRQGDGWDLDWAYGNLLSGYRIGIELPQKLQPGPVAGRISYFAPVSLLFFFFVIFVLTTVQGIDLHPMNYFFMACAFFSFHLLMAYLVDHISIHVAFVICSAVSVFLLVSYLRLVVGMKFAALQAGLAQFVYLVLFSYAFFFDGYAGLCITIGAILTLFVIMQMTARLQWSQKFAIR